MKTDLVYLKHILESIEKISRYLSGVSFDSFLSNEMMAGAVIRELEIVGEAASKISLELKEKRQELPWSEMIGMRHKLIHGYFGVDLKIVWDTCQNNLPELKVKLTPIMESEK